MALFGKYKEYLLGDYCYGLRSSEDSGSLVLPWSLVLNYEHAIRKHAYKVMATAGYTFGAALVHSYREPSVKERNFTTHMANCLQHLAATWELDLRVECVDTKRSAKHDLSLPKVRNSYLGRIRAKEFAAVLLSPPYSSFSRATWANFRGPRSAATSAPGVWRR